MAETNAVPLVEPIPGDLAPEDGIGLCLSGGGFRAMVFHLGALWRLNELGYLPRLARISSVSGGSITAAVLGLHWRDLAFDGQGRASNFEAVVVAPVRRLADRTIDVPAVLKGVFGPGTVSEHVARAYRRHLLGGATLADLPAGGEGPRFVLNAANLQSGALWRFSRPYMADWRVGLIPNPSVELATAVAASSAFPPFLSPARLRLAVSDYDPPAKGVDLNRPEFMERVMLSDGGIYDNLGMETVWKRYTTVLVSDAGGKTQPQQKPRSDWLRHTRRVLDVIDNQVRSLRKRQLIAAFQQKERAGTYWGIRTDIRDYGLADALECPHARTLDLAETSTRLAKLERPRQERLVNWGYAVCDAAMRTWVDRSLPPPLAFPYPRARV